MRLLFAAVAAFTLSASFAAPVGAYSGAPVSVAPLPSGEVLVATYVNLDRYKAEWTRREPVKPVFPQGIPDGGTQPASPSTAAKCT